MQTASDTNLLNGEFKLSWDVCQ